MQNTRSALAYGSVAITWSTSRANGAMPVVSSQRWPQPPTLETRQVFLGQARQPWPVSADGGHATSRCGRSRCTALSSIRYNISITSGGNPL
jgi:hypothetical protein